MPFLLMKRAGIALRSNMGDKNSLMVQVRDHLLKMSLSDDPFLQSSLYTTSPQRCVSETAVILGNAGNIGYLAAKAFACRGTVVAMLQDVYKRQE